MTFHASARVAALLGLVTLAACADGMGQPMPGAMAPAASVEVGGAPMLPSRDIVDNAVNSRDHTTLVSARVSLRRPLIPPARCLRSTARKDRPYARLFGEAEGMKLGDLVRRKNGAAVTA